MDNELFEQRKRMIYDFICDELYVPMKLKELAILMQVPKRDRAELTRVMDALVEDGKVELTKKGKYIKSEKNMRPVFSPAIRRDSVLLPSRVWMRTSLFRRNR